MFKGKTIKTKVIKRVDENSWGKSQTITRDRYGCDPINCRQSEKRTGERKGQRGLICYRTVSERKRGLANM